MDQNTLSMPFGDNPENSGAPATQTRNKTIPKNKMKREDFLAMPQERVESLGSFSKGSLLGVPIDCNDQLQQQREQELFQPFGNFTPCTRKAPAKEGSPLSTRAERNEVIQEEEEDDCEFEDLQKDIQRQLDAPPSPLKYHKKSSVEYDFLQPAETLPVNLRDKLYLQNMWRASQDLGESVSSFLLLSAFQGRC